MPFGCTFTVIYIIMGISNRRWWPTKKVQGRGQTIQKSCPPWKAKWQLFPQSNKIAVFKTAITFLLQEQHRRYQKPKPLLVNSKTSVKLNILHGGKKTRSCILQLSPNRAIDDTSTGWPANYQFTSEECNKIVLSRNYVNFHFGWYRFNGQYNWISSK